MNKPIDEIIEILCDKCPFQQMSVGFIREKVCKENCWIIKSLSEIRDAKPPKKQ